MSASVSISMVCYKTDYPEELDLFNFSKLDTNSLNVSISFLVLDAETSVSHLIHDDDNDAQYIYYAL